MTLSEEISRIKGEEVGGEPPAGAELSHVDVICAGNADQVLRGAQEVLLSVLRAFEDANPNHDLLVSSIPEWFREECAPEEVPEQAWGANSLPLAGGFQGEQKERWSLDSWLHWFTDEERGWRWWSACVITPDLLDVTISVEGWPAPVGSLEWMLLAAGAREVQFDY